MFDKRNGSGFQAQLRVTKLNRAAMPNQAIESNIDALSSFLS